jgi:two-component system capsular synthesis sensor histidine kinase RcsC
MPTSTNSVVFVTPDPTSVTELTDALTELSYDVIIVKDGYRAINLSSIKPNNWKPSLFLVDLIIPNESGFVIAKHLLEKYNDGKVPVIIMTKHYSGEDAMEASQVGALGLLQKPVTLSAMKELIEKEKARRAKSQLADMTFKINY